MNISDKEDRKIKIKKKKKKKQMTYSQYKPETFAC